MTFMKLKQVLMKRQI